MKGLISFFLVIVSILLQCLFGHSWIFVGINSNLLFLASFIAFTEIRDLEEKKNENDN